MKKWIALLLSVLLLLPLVSCSKSSEGTDSEPSDETSQQIGSESGTEQGHESDGTEKAPGEIADCAGVYDFYDRLTSAMGNKISKLVDEHNNAVESDLSQLVALFYLPFSSLRYVDAASFAEGTSLSALESAYHMMGQNDATIRETGKNEYTIAYSKTDDATGETYEHKEVIRFDTSAPALSVVNYRNGEPGSFTEFQALGDNRYAISSEFERAIVVYQDGEILGLNHAENLWKLNPDTDQYEDYSLIFDYEDGKIFGRTDLDEDWVMEAERRDGLYRHYDLQDGICTVTGLKSSYDFEAGKTTYSPGFEVVLP
ncbi:MAG: hypothetical protein IJL15_02395 [Clostridia bacterium]|nr:hypothetical protein [Clostridia bacterium]